MAEEDAIEIRLDGSMKMDESFKSGSSPLKNVTELSMSKENDPLTMSFSERNFCPEGRFERADSRHNYTVARNKKGKTEFDKYAGIFLSGCQFADHDSRKCGYMKGKVL